MKTIYRLVDLSGQRLTIDETYEEITRSIYFYNDMWELIGIETDWDHDTPSNRVVMFKVKVKK